MMRYIPSLMAALVTFSLVTLPVHAAEAEGPGPKVGVKAPGLTLKTVDGKAVSLAEMPARGPVVLVVLRGWPGYQCPACTRQVQELLSQKEVLQKKNAKVLLVYPGPLKQLNDHAREFTAAMDLPAHFQFVTDPDYSMVNAWRLRWDAPKETAYPSTFVIDQQGIIRFAKVSQTHGGRAKTSDILAALDNLKK